MDKNKALIEYIQGYPALYSWLYFNVVNIESGNTSLLTDTDVAVAEYTDGSAEREYAFTVAMMKYFDSGTSDINADALAEAQNFNQWISAKNDNKSFPDWGVSNIINSIEVLTQMPTLSVDNEQSAARYTMQLKINYLALKED